MTRIYLDHNATTPLREEVVQTMLEVMRGRFGNPSSAHAEGGAARAELERARERVASLLGAEPDEVLFTGGATEANNTALLRVLCARGGSGRHLVTSAIEHPSVTEPLAALESQGWQVTRVGVDAEGRVDAEEMAAAIRPETAMVSLIWANNETGVIQPVERVAELAKRHQVLVHSDATQAVGKLEIDLRRVPLDLLSLSAHKFNGPKGVGCLVLRGDLEFEPLLRGGHQERGRRGGTEDVAGAAGLGTACQLAERELPQRAALYTQLRDRLWEGIRSRIPRVRRNGSATQVLPNTLNLEFEGAAGELLLQALDLEGVSVSSGAACAAGAIDPSPVLIAMGRSAAAARGSLRLGVGHGVDSSQIDRVLELLPPLVERVRAAGEA